MNQIATTIEQSKTLIKLGIDDKTADMCWAYQNIKDVSYVLRCHPPFDVIRDIPAWSLTALLNLVEGVWRKVVICDNSLVQYWEVSVYEKGILIASSVADTLFEAVYYTLVKVLMIRQKGNDKRRTDR